MKRIVLCLALCCFLSLKSQTDFGLWSNIAVEKEISKKLDIQLEEELRFNQNVTRLKSLLTEVSIKYKFNDYYSLGGSYRLSYFTENRFGNRFTLSNQVKYKIEDFTLNYRLNFQTDISAKDPIEYKIRNRFGVDYKINKRWAIGMSGELFYSFYYNRNRFDRYRLAGGVDYKINKHHKISSSILFQQEFNVPRPEKDVILGIGYKYNW